MTMGLVPCKHLLDIRTNEIVQDRGSGNYADCVGLQDAFRNILDFNKSLKQIKLLAVDTHTNL